VSLYDSGGSVQLVADVAGYYGDGTGPPGSTFVPVSPVRLLDTRATGDAPGPGQSVSLQIAGSSVSGVPATATAVVLNVTAVKPTGGGYLTAYPEGTARPVVSNLNFSAGEVVANLVTVELGPDGGVSFYNSGGVTQVVVDLAGYFTAAGDTSGSRFVPLVDYRVLDTRHDIGGYSAPVTGGRPIVVQVTGEGGVIDGATAVVVNTTVTGPTAPGYLTVYPGGESVPVASNLNFPAGATLANLVTCELGAGQVEVYASGGTVNAIADVEGWYEPAGS
jgi:hypothetical protein